MPINFRCPSCGAVESRPDYMAGQKTVCATCRKQAVIAGKRMAVPAESPVADDLPEVDLPPERPRAITTATLPAVPLPRHLRAVDLLASIGFGFALVGVVFSALAALLAIAGLMTSGGRAADSLLGTSSTVLVGSMQMAMLCGLVLLVGHGVRSRH